MTSFVGGQLEDTKFNRCISLAPDLFLYAGIHTVQKHFLLFPCLSSKTTPTNNLPPYSGLTQVSHSSVSLLKSSQNSIILQPAKLIRFSYFHTNDTVILSSLDLAVLKIASRSEVSQIYQTVPALWIVLVFGLASRPDHWGCFHEVACPSNVLSRIRSYCLWPGDGWAEMEWSAEDLTFLGLETIIVR